MRLNGRLLAVLCGFGILGMAGCDWKMASEDADTWDDSMSWANFSGTYVTGAAVVITTNGVPSTGEGTLAQIEDEVVGVGNGVDKTFAGSTVNKPIYSGSITITDGTEQFEDGDKDGILVGDKGGTGAINYNTGAFTATFLLQPSAGATILATYLYYVGEGGGGGGGGSSSSTTTGGKSINRLTVTQEGNTLTFVDNDGDTYTGKMGRLSTSSGATDGSASGQAVGNFEVESSGGIKIVGTFEGNYTAPAEGGSYGYLAALHMRGTWIKGNETGNINFTGPSGFTTTTGTTTQ